MPGRRQSAHTHHRRALVVYMFCLLAVAVSLSSCKPDQQVSDDAFHPEIDTPAYSTGKGPVIILDEAHANFHTVGGRYKPFAGLLERDGYMVRPATSRVSRGLLSACTIFAISVPTSKGNQSAYSKEEIALLRDWVKNGGSLLLITDHMPDPPAISELAAAFGIRVNNGYVLNEHPDEPMSDVFFRRTDGTLRDHLITNGRSESEKIHSVTSFTGCAFQANAAFQPLLVFGPDKVSWMTREEGNFAPDTPKVNVEGWFQGGVLEYGLGRVAFFGEAGMFTAQFIGKERTPFGMNVPSARDNAQFLLNVVHWLSGTL